MAQSHTQMRTLDEHVPVATSSVGQPKRSEESWVEISSQTSSTFLTSLETGISNRRQRTHPNERLNRRRRKITQPNDARPTTLPELLKRQASSEDTNSSQEEYDESESESDRVMTSSGEGIQLRHVHNNTVVSPPQSTASDSPYTGESEDESRTAVNYPINTETCFTPQPNIFSHPPSAPAHRASQSIPGSYFPPVNRSQSHNSSAGSRNVLSASYKATVHHDEALRASLSTLLSCAAAARGLKDGSRRPQITPVRINRVEPMTLHLVPESALPAIATSPNVLLQEPVFQPTLRRAASATTVSSSPDRIADTKRRSRPSSKERRAIKKARHAIISNEDTYSPTLLTWVVSAGVVVAVLSALSFSAGFSMGREAGKVESSVNFTSAAAAGDDVVKTCAREASRGGFGLKRSLARSAVSAV